MIDYEARLQEKEAEYREKAVSCIVKIFHRKGQDYTAARAYVFEEFPDMNIRILDNIIFEEYGLQEPYSVERRLIG